MILIRSKKCAKQVLYPSRFKGASQFVHCFEAAFIALAEERFQLYDARLPFLKAAKRGTMSNTDEKFVSSIGCMDGRDRAAIAVLAAGYYVDDVCTGPGTVGILAHAEHPDHAAYAEKFRRQVAVSYGKHGSRTLYVSGHDGCAGHPVEESVHKGDILAAASFARGVLAELSYADMQVVPVWNAPQDGVWTATLLEETRQSDAA